MRDDEAIRRNVESLLADSASDDGFLAAPAVARATQLVAGLVAPTRTGSRLGGYHLQALIGAGGMGEVYRARDARLERDVAIKILPAAFTSNPDRLARFEREARTLAALNHPNICAIYGLEEADGLRFLVLELVEGDTLAAGVAQTRDSQGTATGLPPDRALAIARQIADALEFAHERGIIHRDLKPANINITADGVVKVLDFGLAKAIKGDVGGSDAVTERVTGDTHVGAVMGTAAYMSPEQARGLPVDKRTDIWAFGCVFYEMLTGRTTFAGDTASDSIAKILERDPDWSALPAATPAPVRRLLRRCLMKDPKRRLRDIGDVRIELDAIDEVLPGSTASDVPPAPLRSRTTWLPWAALAAHGHGLGSLGGLGPGRRRRQPAGQRHVLALHELGGHGGARGTLARRQVRRVPRRQGRTARRLGESGGDWDVRQPDARHPSHADTGKPASKPWVFRQRVGDLVQSATGNPGGREGARAADRRHASAIPCRRSVGSSMVARRHPVSSTSAPTIPAIRFLSPAGRARIQSSSTVPDQGQEAFFRKGVHTHNPVWSPDGEWIYFVHGADPFGEMEVWRMRPSGESPEQLTHQNAPVNYPDAAQLPDAAVCGARGGLVRSVAVGAGRRAQASRAASPWVSSSSRPSRPAGMVVA